MIFRVLAHLVLFIHFAWILFLALGFAFALKRSKLAWLHLGGLFFALILNLFEWYCPLTYFENYLYYKGDMKSAYSEPFIIQYLEKFIYPDLPEKHIRIGEIIFLSFYIGVYIYFFEIHRLLFSSFRHKRRE